jgi:hypothetical protein
MLIKEIACHLVTLVCFHKTPSQKQLIYHSLILHLTTFALSIQSHVAQILIYPHANKIEIKYIDIWT